LLRGNPISNSSVVVRKKILQEIGGINESVDMIGAEDYNTWLRIAKITNKFFYLPTVLGYYLVHDNSISKKDMSIPERFAVSEFISDLSAKEKLQLEARLKFIAGKFFYSTRDYVKAKHNFLYAIEGGLISIKIKALVFLIINTFKFYYRGRKAN
jgi:hypothetical protein